MKVFILAGGKGTRLSEYTESLPKPLVDVNGKPLLMHLIDIFLHQGFKDFYILAGYKSNLIKRYFLDFALMQNHIKINMKTKSVEEISEPLGGLDWTVTVIDSGLETLTGGEN